MSPIRAGLAFMLISVFKIIIDLRFYRSFIWILSNDFPSFFKFSPVKSSEFVQPPPFIFLVNFELSSSGVRSTALRLATQNCHKNLNGGTLIFIEKNEFQITSKPEGDQPLSLLFCSTPVQPLSCKREPLHVDSRRGQYLPL